MEIKHVKREYYKINKRHTQINEEFTDSEEETMETVTEEKVLTKCDFDCIGEITITKHVNTKHESVHSDVGEGITDKIWEGAVTDIKDFYQIEIYDGETLFACNICNEGVDDEHSIK